MIYKPQIFEFANLKSLYENLFLRMEKNIIENMAEYSHSRMLVDGDMFVNPILNKLSTSSVIEWDNIELYQSSEEIMHDIVLNTKQTNILESFGDEVVDRLKNTYFFQKKSNSGDAKQNYVEIIESLDGLYFDHTLLSIDENGSIGGIRNLDNEQLINTSEQVISLSPDTLLNSREISIVVNSSGSESVLKELLEGNKSIKEFPAKILFSHPSVKIYFTKG